MTLAATDVPARLNGAHAPPPLAGLPPPREPPLPAAGPPHALNSFDRKTRRVFTHAAYLALTGTAGRLMEGTSRSQLDIARELDISPSTLSKWKARYGWVRPADAPVKSDKFHPRTLSHLTADGRRARMVQRLYRVFDRQTCDLEARAAAAGGRTDEKDARTLSVLAKALETLIALDRDDGASSDTPEPADREQFNADLARRIRRWAEGGARSGEAPAGGKS